MSERSTALQKLVRLPGMLVVRLRRQGPINAVRWSFYQLSWRLRERRLGIDTGEVSRGLEIGDQGEHHGYEPIDYRCFDIVMAHLAVGPGTEGFVDYGCGKGRAVVLAATHPFVKVMGVERSPGLATVARDNVTRARQHLRCDEVRIIEVDARAWPLPPEITVAFLFNSFRGEVLDAVMERIRMSLEEHPRRFRLVYAIPKGQINPLAGLAWLYKVTDLPTGFWDHITCTVYQCVPQAS